jgi:2'-5' RNA ligase
MRAFIAVNLPQEIKDILELAIKNLAKINHGAKINWTRPENLHLTLHFLDEISDAEAELIKAELDKIAAEYDKVGVSLGEIDAFPDIKNPRTIVIGIRGGEILEKIQKKIGFEMKRFNLPVDIRPWKSHVTLGRVKTGLAKIAVPPPAGKFEIANLELIKSTLTSTGPIYEVLKSFELQ